MRKFKVGDRVKIKKYCSGVKVGEKFKLYLDNGKLWAGKSGYGSTRCHCQNNWELIENKPKMKIVTPFQKALERG